MLVLFFYFETSDSKTRIDVFKCLTEINIAVETSQAHTKHHKSTDFYYFQFVE